MASATTKRKPNEVLENNNSWKRKIETESTEELTVWNQGGADSLYHALEDAESGISYQEIKEFCENQNPSVNHIEEKLEKFAKKHKFTIIFEFEEDEEISLDDSHTSKSKIITINEISKPSRKLHIREHGTNYVAIKSTKENYFSRAIQLSNKANSKFRRYWPPKTYFGSSVHCTVLKKTMEETFKEVTDTLNKAIQSDTRNSEGSLAQKEKPIIVGMFAEPKSGKSFVFNHLLLASMEGCSEDAVRIGPSATSNQMHSLGCTLLPIWARYGPNINISLRKSDGSQEDTFIPLINNSAIEGALKDVVKKVKEWNEQMVTSEETQCSSYIELLIPSPLLRDNNLEIIDFPGIITTSGDASDKNKARLVKDLISRYLEPQPTSPTIVDIVLLMKPGGRALSETVFLNLYYCGYFSSTDPPKLIYLVNDLRGLENTDDYKNEKPEINQAKARTEITHALYSFLGNEKYSHFGIDAEMAHIITNRAHAIPFFCNPFQEFDSVKALQEACHEVTFHRLRCHLLNQTQQLTERIMLAKLLVIATNKKEGKQVLRSISELVKKHQREVDIQLKTDLFNGLDPSVDWKKKIRDVCEAKEEQMQCMRQLWKEIATILHTQSANQKMKLIEDIRQKVPFKDDSEITSTVETTLNTVAEAIDSNSPFVPTFPPEIAESIENSELTEDRCRSALRSFISHTLNKLRSYSPISDGNGKVLSGKNEELKKKLIRYENLLRELQLKFSPLRTQSSKTKEKKTGVPKNIVIKRHEAPKNDICHPLNEPPQQPIYHEQRYTRNDNEPDCLRVDIDVNNQLLVVSGNIKNETYKRLQERGRHISSTTVNEPLIHPIFVPSKLRGRNDDEVAPPQLYAEQFHDFPGTLVIPVIDTSETDRYRDYLSKANIHVLFLLEINNSILAINVGKKRQIIKIVAEKILDLDFYWVLDDDVETFIEVGVALKRDPCSVGRALYYGQLVMQEELKQTDYVEKAYELLKDVQKAQPDSYNRFEPEFVTCFLSNNDMKKAIMQLPKSFEKWCIDCGHGDELKNLQDTMHRVGQIALYNRIDKCSEYRNYSIKTGNYSHINRQKRYQVVLFNSNAMRGIDYMKKKDFFRIEARPSHYGSKKEDKIKAAKAGFKHEDWYIVQRMKKFKRTGYLVFRYCFENCASFLYPSIVDQIAKPVPINSAILTEEDSTLDENSEETNLIQVET